LDLEYKINDILYALMQARSFVSGETSINEAIKILKEQTRFANEIEETYLKKLGFASLTVNENNKL